MRVQMMDVHGLYVVQRDAIEPWRVVLRLTSCSERIDVDYEPDRNGHHNKPNGRLETHGSTLSYWRRHQTSAEIINIKVGGNIQLDHFMNSSSRDVVTNSLIGKNLGLTEMRS